jgi:arabinose-5-phosphate isomerase
MSRSTARSSSHGFSVQPVRSARQIILREVEALSELAARLDESFANAVDLVRKCQGSVIVTGMGKAGLIGQKIAATLASTGTPSHYVHPAEAVHGDLGKIRRQDVVIVLSFSGETEEIVRLLPSMHEVGVAMVAVTGRPKSRLARCADVTLNLGPVREAGSLELAPSSSTTSMLALGDALALVVSELRGFTASDFARCHPGGSLGRQLARVEDVMRPLEQCRVASQVLTTRQVIVEVGQPGRRTGAIMLIDAEGTLTGVFTDSDLARLFEARHESALDEPIRESMTRNPTTITIGGRLSEAVDCLVDLKISELPVVDDQGRPRGLIDITDVVSLLPPGEDLNQAVWEAVSDDKPPIVRFPTGDD